MRKPQIEFSPIPLEEIPGRRPITPIASGRAGSQWDEVLAALEQYGDSNGVKIPASNEKDRQRLKSTLQTIAKIRDMPVEVLDDKNGMGFFAWRSDRGGRFAGPSVRKAR